MHYTLLGRTGLNVSVAGLGCGGNSRLGQGTGKTEGESIAVVRAAVESGVNFIDTAAAYGTETIVGKALLSFPRDEVVVSTKSLIKRGETLLPAKDIATSLENSLRALRMDHVDVFHCHAVTPAAYDYVLDAIVPALLRERDKGKLRYLGITETPPHDPEQNMLQRAVDDDCWEVMMLGFHMLNQQARRKVFPSTQKKGIGTLLMFVVRNIFSVAGRLQAALQELAEQNKVPRWLADSADPLGFLIHPEGASSVIDAAYRYARHEPGADVILFGTGTIAHLKSNIGSILKPPLPAEDAAKLADLFGHLQGVGLDLPERVKKGSP